MGATSETTGSRLLASATEEFAKFPFDPATIKYNPNNSWSIDPSKQYPKCYEEFMTVEGFWDMYGNLHAAFDGMTMIDEAEVKKICDKRQKKLDDKMAKELAVLEKKMKDELMQRFHERELLEDEVDTTSIDDMFDIYSELGGLGEDSQQQELEDDFKALEEIVGELDYEQMSILKQTNPGMFIVLIFKVFNFLMYLAHIPIKDKHTGEERHINLYEKAMETLISTNKKPDGEMPDWLKSTKTVFDWGKHYGNIAEKA